MPTTHYHTTDSLSSLTAALQHYAYAGIDPAFDDDVEVLERQFAELRLTFDNH
jgi:hypothetical protein